MRRSSAFVLALLAACGDPGPEQTPPVEDPAEQVTPEMALESGSALVGERFLMRGSGFVPLAIYRVVTEAPSSASLPLPERVVASQEGTFSIRTAITAPGAWRIEVQTNKGRKPAAAATWRITASITCGDQICGEGETCQNCVSDCGACPPVCGNGDCQYGETCDGCPQDCGACPVCGNGDCEPDETCETCAGDCGACPVCGNSTCEDAESCASCPFDCGECVAQPPTLDPLGSPTSAEPIIVTGRAEATALVRVYVDSTLAQSATAGAAGTFSAALADVADGSHSITATAAIGTGPESGRSNAISVQVDHSGPAVTLTSPAAQAIVQGTVSLAATASDALGVARVEFWAAGALVGTDASAPYAASWNTTAAADGSQPVEARAFDTLGNLGTASVTVTVQNGAPAGAIAYTLPAAGKVSLAVYNADGTIAKTLLAGAAKPSGVNAQPWDARNEAGAAVADGTYSWKLLQTQGLQARYLMTLGSTWAPGADWWQRSPGDRHGPTGLFFDGWMLYVASGGAQNVSAHVKLTGDGATRVWSAWEPDAGLGGWALAADAGRYYLLMQNAKIAVTTTDAANSARARQCIGCGGADSVGEQWDALWTGDARPTADSWNGTDRLIPMDLAAGQGQLVVSYRDHDTIRWLDPATGAELDSAPVTAPKGVAIDADGSVLAVSGTSLVRLSRAFKTPLTVVGGLEAPWRVEVERAGAHAGEILVVEHGASQQIKRFSAAGALLATYGRAGGRQEGLYVPTDFLHVHDLVTDGQGGFWIAEPDHTPRRVAHFDYDGALVKELVGSQHGPPNVTVDPLDPTVVWTQYVKGELARLKIDPVARTWSIHSTYRYAGLGGGLIGDDGRTGRGGRDQWNVRKQAGVTYLVRSNEIEVLRLDEAAWTLKAVAKAFRGTDVGGVQSAWIWTDADGDGQPVEAEYRRYAGVILWDWDCRYLAPTLDGFTYGCVDNATGAVKRFPVDSWNAVGAPVYRSLDAPVAFGALPQDFQRGSLYTSPPSVFVGFEAGPLYATVENDAGTWAAAADPRMVRFNADGTLAWWVGRSQARPAGDLTRPSPGSVFAFKKNLGLAHDVVLAQDFNGGWDGARPASAITYGWDRDGLWVGGLLDEPELTAAPAAHYYTLAGDNGAGDLYQDPVSGKVYYYGSQENELRLYEVTGWDRFARLHGTVTVTGGQVTSSEVQPP